jgi:hypothetical protein
MEWSKIFNPTWQKILVSYLFFVLLSTINDAVYWCILIKSNCTPASYPLNLIANLFNPLHIAGRIFQQIKNVDFGGILMNFILLGVSYVLPCVLLTKIKTQSVKK